MNPSSSLTTRGEGLRGGGKSLQPAFNDAVRQALGQVVTDLQTQAPNEFTPQDLQALQFKHHLEKESFEQMVTKEPRS